MWLETVGIMLNKIYRTQNLEKDSYRVLMRSEIEALGNKTTLSNNEIIIEIHPWLEELNNNFMSA